MLITLSTRACTVRTVGRHEFTVHEPGDLRLGDAHDLAGEADGEAHLDATVPQSHGELRRHGGHCVEVRQRLQGAAGEDTWLVEAPGESQNYDGCHDGMVTID